MTIKLSGIFEEHFQVIFEDYKEARRFYENVNFGGRNRNFFLCQKSSRHLKKKFPRKSRESESEMDQDARNSAGTPEATSSNHLMTINEEETNNVTRRPDVCENNLQFEDETDENEAMTSSCSSQEENDNEETLVYDDRNEDTRKFQSETEKTIPVTPDEQNSDDQVQNIEVDHEETVKVNGYENAEDDQLLEVDDDYDDDNLDDKDSDKNQIEASELSEDVEQPKVSRPDFIKKPTRNVESHETFYVKSDVEFEECVSYSFRNRNPECTLKEQSSSSESEDSYQEKPPPRSVRRDPAPSKCSNSSRSSRSTLAKGSRPLPPPLEPSPKKRRVAKNRSKRPNEMRSEASSNKSQRSSARIATSRSLNLTYMYYYESDYGFSDEN